MLLLFIILTIFTIYCVINAIRPSCKRAASDAVFHLQFNNKDVWNFPVVTVYLDIPTAQPHQRHVCAKAGFKLVSPDSPAPYQVRQKPSYLQRVALCRVWCATTASPRKIRKNNPCDGDERSKRKASTSMWAFLYLGAEWA